MNLKQKHILAVSAIAGIAGVVGYFIGHKVGYERGYSDALPDNTEAVEMVETPELYKKFFNVDRIPKSIVDNSEVFGSNGYYGLKKRTPKLEWSDNPWPRSTYVDTIRDQVSSFKERKLNENLVSNYISDDEQEALRKAKKHMMNYTDGLLNIASAMTEAMLEDDEEGTDDEELENIRTQGEVEYTSSEPYLVTEDEVYGLESVPDEIESLTYYKADNVLADSFDDIVTEKDLVLGPTIEEINEGDGDIKTFYVRNPHTRRDYEIVVVDASYEQEVLGADDEQYINAVKYFNLGDE